MAITPRSQDAQDTLCSRQVSALPPSPLMRGCHQRVSSSSRSTAPRLGTSTAPTARVLCGSGAGRRAALAPAPLSPGLAGGGGSSAEGGAAVRLAGGGSGSGPRVGWAWYGQRGLRRASGRSPPPLSGVRCAALGLARFGAATDERLASEGWRTQAWPPMLASPTKKKKTKQIYSSMRGFLLIASAAAVELTLENWDDRVAGKSVLVKFHAPW